MAPTWSKHAINPSAVNSKMTKNPWETPPIPLALPKREEPKKGDFQKVELKINHSDPDSKKFSTNVRIFKQGTPEELILWRKDFARLEEGLPLTLASAKYQMAKQLLDGEAKRVFLTKAKAKGEETEEHFKEILQELMTHFFPSRHYRDRSIFSVVTFTNQGP